MAKPKKDMHKHSREEAREELKQASGCMSCGLPMAKTPRESASEIADYCPACVAGDGHLKSYDDVFERLVTKHFMKELKMSRPEAEKAAKQKMTELPAWKHL
ncbi:MAG TPA: zinc ribbon domain-containing protein [Thermoplasmata archaeon]